MISIKARLDGNETYAALKNWPCSSLSGRGVDVCFQDGDLVDIEIDNCTYSAETGYYTDADGECFEPSAGELNCLIEYYFHTCRPGDRVVEKNPFEAQAFQLAQVLEQKRKSYGDSANISGKLLSVLYPYGIRPEQYGECGLIVRILDKLCRIATGKVWFNEDGWMDLAGYAMLGWKMTKDGQKMVETEVGNVSDKAD